METVRTGREVRIDYTNWQGVRKNRVILPLRMWFGTSDFHKAPQWFIKAIDLEKDELRDFAVSKIHAWELIELS